MLLIEMTDQFKLKRPKIGLRWIVLLVGLSIGGCATLDSESPDIAAGDSATAKVPNPDPLEAFNRSVYAFNADFDKALGKPIARGYVNLVPQPIRRSVSNFYFNLWEPNSIINALLQGKFQKAASSTTRFMINSTVGILGLFDVASKLDVPRQEEDFGQTLAVWGVKDGPYLMIPFLGPANLRDTVGFTTEFYTTDLVPIIFDHPEIWAVRAVRLVDLRASVLGLDDALQFQVDPYVFLRESYRQSRLIQINDGAVPLEPEEDPFEDELFKD